MVSWRHECTGHTQPGIPELPVSGLALPGGRGERNRDRQTECLYVFICVTLCVCMCVCMGEGEEGRGDIDRQDMS